MTQISDNTPVEENNEQNKYASGADITAKIISDVNQKTSTNLSPLTRGILTGIGASITIYVVGMGAPFAVMTSPLFSYMGYSFFNNLVKSKDYYIKKLQQLDKEGEKLKDEFYEEEEKEEEELEKQEEEKNFESKKKAYDLRDKAFKNISQDKREEASKHPYHTNSTSLEDIKYEDTQKEFTCPLTLNFFKYPVRAEDGRIYEQEALHKYVSQYSNISPFDKKTKIGNPGLLNIETCILDRMYQKVQSLSQQPNSTFRKDYQDSKEQQPLQTKK